MNLFLIEITVVCKRITPKNGMITRENLKETTYGVEEFELQSYRVLNRKVSQKG